MGFKLKVEGAETIELGIENILTVEFNTDTPDDSNARSTDLGTSLSIKGKILTPVDGEAADSTIKLAKWSLVPSEKADCYRKVTVDVISASQVVRQINLPNAFVVSYAENYGDEEGVGTFILELKQKKDKTTMVKFQGGFGE
ncbi:membrane-associated protease 1 [Clostridium estertheticum]|uniref:Membrane-associated protease 1 n=2 Tax=Clostridium estertheticum TaxID=238834 RepID=A0A1J0GFZ8_9CLOT|nr:membrane-associated protease 1 [Clostridium estertheticum]APC40289.1 membrane-associated protease 1 [Clostridium estertheticum subsp. estertheticum]MBU3075490.1 membrane-associated protease 1 [Clostridium estertheticum]MBU3165680.1 membrane-associated protease 1 [Clostridium estertheticum]MBU3170533.1 membrane-associated protease 1 [Clostridium estertheticum]MBX4262417.1 membrane-associated protease 1 [Clostridium estertheticum]